MLQTHCVWSEGLKVEGGGVHGYLLTLREGERPRYRHLARGIFVSSALVSRQGRLPCPAPPGPPLPPVHAATPPSLPPPSAPHHTHTENTRHETRTQNHFREDNPPAPQTFQENSPPKLFQGGHPNPVYIYMQ